MHEDPFDFDRPCDPPLEYVRVPQTGERGLPEAFRQGVACYTVHDGGSIPHRFRYRDDGGPLVDLYGLKKRYVEGRDWGANLVAAALASALALPGYARVGVARVLLDFNRFPGSTPMSVSDPLESLAIDRLYGEVLDHGQQTALLEDFYDPISDQLEEVLANKLISIAVHTYDEHNPSATKRADLSIVSLPLSYQRQASMTYGVFDPLYPDDLAESTCNRILRDRVSLDLERAGFRVIHNHPYAMPDGAIEIRAQVWLFFRHLRKRFVEAHPGTADDPAYQLLWTMLLDTNLRLAEAEGLRSYLHRFRKVPPGQVEALEAAREAYRHVRQFLRGSGVVDEYRRSPDRPSSLGIEVRKDLLCTFDPETGAPKKTTDEQKDVAAQISLAIAGAINTYIETDRGL